MTNPIATREAALLALEVAGRNVLALTPSEWGAGQSIADFSENVRMAVADMLRSLGHASRIKDLSSRRAK